MHYCSSKKTKKYAQLVPARNRPAPTAHHTYRYHAKEKILRNRFTPNAVRYKKPRARANKINRPNLLVGRKLVYHHFRRNRARLPDITDLIRIRSNNREWFELPENVTVSPSRPEVQWYGNSYIPYRYRCQSSIVCSANRIARLLDSDNHSLIDRDHPADRIQKIPFCSLVRLNYELPFTELPNLVAATLSSDMLSGNTMVQKLRFLLEIFQASLDKYMTSDSSGEIFVAPQNSDSSTCKFKRSTEPLMRSLYTFMNILSTREGGEGFVTALTKSAKACKDKEDEYYPLSLLPCLDFSVGSEQVLLLQDQRTLFGNQELCRRFLKVNISRCLLMDQPHSCTEEHLVALNNFARRFYMCVGILQHSSSSGQVEEIYVGEPVVDAQQLEVPPSKASTHFRSFLTSYVIVLCISLSCY
ncbi:uncharacterized protein LOC129581198 isoform X2 [Paramacrobiotus metropolitanus]|nr:uncharacterized protein LOC129581198 isoform X2 [Paramacrobiotus metropolitanus]